MRKPFLSEFERNQDLHDIICERCARKSAAQLVLHFLSVSDRNGFVVAKPVDVDALSPAAARLYRIRRRLKLSRKEFADKLGVSYLQVYRIENGITAIDLAKAAEFGSRLGIRADVLIFGKRRSA